MVRKSENLKKFQKNLKNSLFLKKKKKSFKEEKNFAEKKNAILFVFQY